MVATEQPRGMERRILRAQLGDGDGQRTTRDWLHDGACVLVALAVGATAYGTSVGRDISTFGVIVDLVLGGLGLVTLLWRRQNPVALALIVSAASAVSAGAAGPALALLFTVAVHRRPTIAVAVGAVSLIPAAVFIAIYPTPGQDDWWINAIFSVAFTATVVAWGSFVRARRQLVVSLALRARDAEAGQQARVERARTDERARIAREMHDVLAHRLSLLSLHAGALEFRPDAPPDEVARAAGVIRSSAHSALTELREVIGVLRAEPGAPAQPEPPQPTLAELPALLEECRAAGTRLDAEVGADLAAMPVGLGRTAYRIVQEGLTNARKHAPGARVEVEVAGAPGDGLLILVRNPLGIAVGAGPLVPGAGTGLVGLVERATLAGGSLEHEQTDAGAFVLRAWLPWPA